MSVETAASRFTCRDCRKTYRSFRTEEEWLASHLAAVCPAAPRSPMASVPVAPSVDHPPSPISEPARRWQRDPIALAAAMIAGLILLGVAFDAYRTLSDSTNGAPRSLQTIMTLAVAGPCLYGVSQLARSVLPVPDRGDGR